MHNPPPPSSPSPPSPPPPPPSALNMDSIDESSTLIWDWSQFLDFNIDDHLPFPGEESNNSPPIPTSQEVYPIDNPQVEPVPDSFPVNSTSNTNNRVRKRDPMMACPNFLAGRIPCACPELDALLVAEEEDAAPGKKKSRSTTARTAASSRCQVPSCGVDISELKGYHKRHRVCLRCANATTVVLDGLNKRYCQQCGKFHILSDFDEGKRSCRRKLERHNNRRRRKPSESKNPGTQSADYDDGYDESGKGTKSTSSEAAGEKSLTLGPTHAQIIHSDSIPSLAASGETQTDEEKEKGNHSPSYGDDKSAFSSVCPTGRISFKLYDWNPAEFPRRLRHQIFQWLASMPVELEGYIRPGCTILTIFIAMPRVMWLKLNEDPVVCIHDFVASPRNLLSGRDTFFVNFNSMIFGVMKGGKSVIKIKSGEKAPKLHYVEPSYFEAGKPIEFLACGTNLLQPRLRFLVSFAGKYMTNDVSVSQSEASSTNFDNQLLNVSVPCTELDVFGPGFIEVENESGLSNFIPILIADEEVCSEIKIMQRKYYSKEYVFREKKFSELLVDMAWLLKQPVVVEKEEEIECVMMSSQLERFTCVLDFLIEYESTTVLKRILKIIKMKIMKNENDGDGDVTLLQERVNHATEILRERVKKKVNRKDDHNQKLREMVVAESSHILTSGDKTETVALLNAEYIMSVTPGKEQERPMDRRVFAYNTKRLFPTRPLVLVATLVTVCFGICAVVFHPHRATEIAITIRRCLFDDK